MADDETKFGPNEWLVEEMYDQFKIDPNSVSDSWREFFADYRAPSGNGNAAAVPPAPAAPVPPAAPERTEPAEPAPASAVAPRPEAAEEGTPIRGAAARIVA